MPRVTTRAITFWSVCPASLRKAIAAQIPFQHVEQGLLEDGRGVGRRQKALLMVLRVFTHIVYFVVPDMLEVVREERFGAAAPAGLIARMGRLRRALTDLAVAAICASIRYIPLWAVEIAALPESAKGPHSEAGGRMSED